MVLIAPTWFIVGSEAYRKLANVINVDVVGIVVRSLGMVKDDVNKTPVQDDATTL